MHDKKEIEPQVVLAFSFKTGKSVRAITTLMAAGHDNIADDLGMSDEAKDGMSGLLTKISTQYEGGLGVPISAVRKCDTVNDCVDLTVLQANGGKK